MPLSSCLLAPAGGLHAVAVWAETFERLDTWVFRVGIAVPVLCIALLVAWHLLAGVTGKLFPKRKAYKHSPEPPTAVPSPQRLPSERIMAANVQTVSPADADDAHAEGVRRARELLAQTREDFRNQRFMLCLERCKALAAAFPHLPEGAEAKLILAQIKNDPEKLQTACASLVATLAEMYLELAEGWMRKGAPEQAAVYFEKIVQSCPDSPESRVAQSRLRQLRL